MAHQIESREQRVLQPLLEFFFKGIELQNVCGCSGLQDQKYTIKVI